MILFWYIIYYLKLDFLWEHTMLDWTRIITGLILAVVAILAIFVLPNIYFNIFIGLIIFLGSLEWCALYSSNNKKNLLWSILLFIIIAVVSNVLLYYSGYSDKHPHELINHNNLIKFILYLSLLLWVCVFFGMFIFKKIKHWRWVKSKYIALPLGLMILVPIWLGAFITHEIKPLLLFYIVICVSMTDVAAYFFGKYLGKNKLCPNFSPKKTIEGLFGGVIVAELLAIVLGYLFFHKEFPSILVLSIIMFIVIILSVVGDLFESIIKRSLGVKDSGNILPGHGGVLDRIDSLIAALPVAVSLMFLFSVIS